MLRGGDAMARARRAVGLAVVMAAVGPAWLVHGAGAATVTQTVAPVADAYVSAKKPTANFGTDKQLRVGANPRQTGYLRFDVQGLSGTVVKATLRVNASA